MFCAAFISCNQAPLGYSRIQPINRELRGDSTEIYVPEDFPIVAQRCIAKTSLSIHPGVLDKLSQECIDVYDMIEDYRYLSFENSENSILGKIDDILIDDNRLFLVDHSNNRVLSFDKEGNFICKIGQRGKGHNEYLSLSHFSLNKRTKEVCILDFYSRKLLFYDYNGKHTNTKPLYYFTNAAAFHNDQIILQTIFYESKNVPSVQKSHLVVTDMSMVPISGILPNRGFPAWKENGGDFSVHPYRMLRTYPDGVYYSDVLSPDTIWRYDGEKVYNEFSADFGPDNLFVTSEQYKTMTTEMYRNRINKVAYVRGYEFSKDFIWLRIRGVYMIVNRKTNKYIGCGTWYSGNDVPSIIPNFLDCLGNEVFVWDWENNEFACFIDPIQLEDMADYILKRDKTEERDVPICAKDLHLLKNADAEDNPVLLIFRIKSF